VDASENAWSNEKYRRKEELRCDRAKKSNQPLTTEEQIEQDKRTKVDGLTSTINA
jgi:hypothetical protein